MKTMKHSFVLALTAVTLLATSTQAQDRFWSAGSGDWSNAANWGGDVPDTSVERAYFAGVGNAINMDADFLAGAIRANFGAEGGINTLSGPGTLTINGTVEDNAGNKAYFTHSATIDCS